MPVQSWFHSPSGTGASLPPSKPGSDKQGQRFTGTQSPGNNHFCSWENMAAQSYFARFSFRSSQAMDCHSSLIAGSSLSIEGDSALWGSGPWVHILALVRRFGRTSGQSPSPSEHRLINLQSGDNYRGCLVRGLRGLTNVSGQLARAHAAPRTRVTISL